jgi:hypothetical protein
LVASFQRRAGRAIGHGNHLVSFCGKKFLRQFAICGLIVSNQDQTSDELT